MSDANPRPTSEAPRLSIVSPGPDPMPTALLRELDGRPPPFTLEQAYEHCERIARTRTENFPVGSRLVPYHLRRYIHAAYAFVVTSLQLGDDPRYAEEREKLLDYWERQTERAFHGQADHPILVALQDTIEKRNVPLAPFQDMLTALRMHVSTLRYTTFDDLACFCRYAAQPFGRLLLYVFGYHDVDLHRYADELSTGLALTKRWQNVGRDAERGRIYVPLADLVHFRVKEEEILARQETAAFRDLMRFQVARTRAILDRARPLCDAVARDLRFELRMIWLGGSAALDRVAETGYRVLRRRPVLTAADWARIGARAAVWATTYRINRYRK